ncbi:hypothetical protein BH23ACT5_BH23ACT5_08000 [soil metagenome]
MPDPKQIPELATELFEMSKEYLRQETIEPAKRLGRVAGRGVLGALLFAIASVFGVLAVYSLLQYVLPPTGEVTARPWFDVLARGLTALVAAAAAWIIAWRMSTDDSTE